jgi:hypothetical protein
MGLIFRLVVKIFSFFSEVFVSLNKQNKDRRLRNKIIGAHDLEIEKLDKSDAKKELDELFKVYIQILDKNHEYYKTYILGPSKEHLFYELSRKFANFEKPIFNKKAMDVCNLQELYLFTYQLGILFYTVVNFDVEKN